MIKHIKRDIRYTIQFSFEEGYTDDRDKKDHAQKHLLCTQFSKLSEGDFDWCTELMICKGLMQEPNFWLYFGLQLVFFSLYKWIDQLFMQKLTTEYKH